MQKIFLAENPFQSIQGEGAYSGKVSTFIRLAGCNLMCDFGGSKCDTQHGLKRNARNFEYTIKQILAEISEFENENIVITGGEPTLFMDELSALCKAFYGKYHTTIETNGTNSFQLVEAYLPTVFLSVSPKIGVGKFQRDKGGKVVEVEDLDFLNNIAYARFQLKFVCPRILTKKSMDDFLSMMLSVIKKVGETPTARTLLHCIAIMPNGSTLSELMESQDNAIKAVIELKKCVKSPYPWARDKIQYTDRLQVRLWNDKKGV